jgi:fibronectin-binding autotransporter adhesin
MPTTDFWNGTGNWSTDDAAWSDNNPPGSPPVPTEDAEIETGTATLTSAETIAGLQVDAPAALVITTGGTLTDTGLGTVAGALELSAGGSASVTGGLSITGNGLVWVDSPNNNGGGGSNLAVGGTLTVSSTNNNALSIGNGYITTGDTVTATALVNTGVIEIQGNGTIQSTLDITTGAAGFGTIGVETGSVILTSDALLEFASGQIGTIDGYVSLNGTNARIADAGTLTTNSALMGLNTVAGELELSGGAAVGTNGALSITGNGLVWVDSPNNNGYGGSNLAVGGTLTVSSTNNNALSIGNGYITTGDTVTATALVNTGVIEIQGNGTVQSTLDITTGAAGFGTVGVETGSVSLIGDALLEFASGQIGTIDGYVSLNGPNALIADAGTLTTNSALVGLNTVAGELELSGGAAVSTNGALTITGNGVVWVDSPNNNGGGGSSLAVGGTLTVSSTNNNALSIGNGYITTGDTVTATALVNTGVIEIQGNGTIQSTLDITTGAAGFGTIGVETGSVILTSDALLEFASGQIGTIDGYVSLNGTNARIADAGTLTTNSALMGLNTVAGELELSGGAAVGTNGALSITGNGLVWVDSPNNNGYGGSNLAVGGTLTVSSTNNNALSIGNGYITTGDTVTAKALVNTGVIDIQGNGTIQSTLDITTGAAGFGTVGVETGSVSLTNDALLEFASGQIGTIDGYLSLSGANARIADAGTLTTNSALTGLGTVAGDFELSAGVSVTTTGSLNITGNGVVWLDSPNNNGGGGSSLAVGGTLTVSSTNNNALSIGNGYIVTGDTVTAKALVNTGVIDIQGNGTIQSTLDITTGAAGFGTVGVETGSVSLTNDALLEFASGQIGTIDGYLSLSGANARIADAGTLATNSALTGLGTVAGDFELSAGVSVTTTGSLNITGNGVVWLDSPNNNGGGGSSLNVGGTLTVSSTNNNALSIGNGYIVTGDTVTAKALVNTGVIDIQGNGTIQSTLDITNGAAGFGTVGVETGSVSLTSDALLEFASGQIGTIDGYVSLDGTNARIADAGTLTTNSALTGLNTVAGELELSGGAAVSTNGALSITGNGVVWVDSPNNNGGGGSSLNVGGTLTVGSTNGNALSIGNNYITTGDTVTAKALVNDGAINIQGNGAIVATLAVNGPATNSATVNINGSGDVVMGAGDIYTQAAGATNINGGGTLAGIVDVTGGAVNVVSGGTLAGTANVTGGSLDGTGTVVGTVNDTSGGTVFGGLSIGTPGVLTVNGNYDQSGTGDLEANLGSGGTTSGVVADTGGYVNLTGGTLSVSSTPPVGTVLTVMTFGAGDLVGQFAAIQDGTAIGDGSNVNLGDGTSIEVSYNNAAGNIQIERVNNSSLATTYNWTDGTANWSTATDWSGGQVPNPTANVVIGNTATGNVTLNGSSGDQTVNALSILASNALTVSGVTLTSANGITVAANGSLSLSNGEINGSVLSGAGLLQTVSGTTGTLAGDTIAANTTYVGQNNSTTQLLGLIDNAGTLQFYGGSGNNADVNILDGVTLTGGGLVALDNQSGGGNLFVQGNGQTLTNAQNTIQGTAIFGNGSLALINNSVIDATPEGGTTTLVLNGSGGITNTGTMEATAGGVLQINGNTVDNANGNITVADATSTVELDGATVQGGTLNNAAGGTLETISSAELDGATQGALTLSTGSTYTASNGATTYLLGSLVNQGVLQLNGGAGNNGFLVLNSNVTLTGGGTVTLTDTTGGGNAYIEGNGWTLTNTNNTIQGTGIIGNGSLALINNRVIDATPEGSTATLVLNGSAGITNTGTMEATAGGVLQINGNTVDNANGNITVADATSTVELDGATVQGGTLNNAAGGTLETISSAELDGTTQGALTLSTGSTYTANNGTSTYLLGSIVNKGVVQLNGGAGNNGFLVLNSNVTLTGSGIVTLTDTTGGGSAYIQGNGLTLTNTNNTIQGTGVIGNGSMALINQHVIDATPEGGTPTLVLNGSGGITNTATMEATAGGVLQIYGNTVDNSGGTITVADATSTVELYGATVQGGTLKNAAGGTLETISSAELDGTTHGALTLSTGSTYTANNGTSTYLLGSIVNQGLVQLFGGNGNNAFLVLNSNVTLTGGGTVTLNDQSGGGADYLQGNGLTLTNTNNTIQGTGVIGDGSMALVNQHVIDATPEDGTSTLLLNGGGITNTATMEATAGGILTIDTNVNNTGGMIIASGTLSTVDIEGGVTITGGTLKATSTAVLETASGSSAALQGITLSAGSTYTGTDNSSTELLGTIDNLGTIEQIGGNGNNGYLNIGNSVTLTGGGTVTLDEVSGGGVAAIQGNSQTLTNTNNTIQGTGNIGNGSLLLVNNGVIDATPEGGTSTLLLNGGFVTNTATMEATAGGVLTIDTNVNNAGGMITASGTSTVDIEGGVTITGGTLNATSTAVLETAPGSSAVLQGVTLSAGSTYVSTNNSNTYLLGTIDNVGTIEQIGGGGNNGALDIANNVTLTGGGTVTLDTQSGGGVAIIQGNGNTLTNTNNTIQGTGNIGDGSLLLVNNGVIDATPEGGTSTLLLNGGLVTNTATMEATAGGVLTIDANVNNAGGMITASGTSTVDIESGVTITGGTLNAASTAVLETAPGNSAVLQGVTLSAGSTYVSTDNSNTYLLGTIDNVGTIEQIGGSGNNGALDISNSVTLTGGGTVTLDTQSGGGVAIIQGNGNTLTNTNNTIQGTGVIGNGSLALINNGVIDATPEGGTSTLTINTGAFSSTGTLEATGGATLALDVGAVTVSGLVSVAASSALDLTGELTVNGTLANFGAVSGGGATEVAFGSGTDRLILGPGATFGGNVVGGGVHTTLELAAGTGAGTLSGLGTEFTNFGTVIVDTGATWTVDATTAQLATTTFIGDGAGSTLVLTGAGTFSLANVSNFGTIDLPAGNNTVTVTDKTLSGGTVTINDGASGNNTISAASDTSASKGKSLTYVAGTGTDSFTGGFENDTVDVASTRWRRHADRRQRDQHAGADQRRHSPTSAASPSSRRSTSRPAASRWR